MVRKKLAGRGKSQAAEVLDHAAGIVEKPTRALGDDSHSPLRHPRIKIEELPRPVGEAGARFLVPV
jgi:hypothetical protein